jgi:hypothetical protein
MLSPNYFFLGGDFLFIATGGAGPGESSFVGIPPVRSLVGETKMRTGRLKFFLRPNKSLELFS